MSSSYRGGDERSLDALFQAYRDACQAPEPSPNFMPLLWQRIEARQNYSFFFGRLAKGIVTAAVAICLGMAVYLSVPRHSSALFNESYVEALSGGHNLDADQLHADLFPEPDEM
ncbi:MAG TPA: hypothetical protein VFA33_11430 [Bryobacteraceae bacterium]|nr:hypothetical protein [Bryobacteraceae bacterium]